MVLILSERSDFSTNHILDWLNYYRIKWLRINENDSICIHKLEYRNNKITCFEILVNDQTIDLTHVSSYWYRRGWLNYQEYQVNASISSNPVIQQHILRYLKEELNGVMGFIHYYLQASKPSINSFLNGQNNKSYYQFIAAKVGLTVPDTTICTRKIDVQNFYNDRGELITKSIHELFSFVANRQSYYAHTYEISDREIDESNEIFFPTLFQSRIQKFLELRIFFLNDEFYAMAIFSQQNEKTKVDFRNYDRELPNRVVPFQIPKHVEIKLTEFMKLIHLNCGSIDMILTPKNDYVFLEVNPVGQFGMVSYPCNYYIERKIAQTLA